MTGSNRLSPRKEFLFSIFSILWAIILATTILEIGIRFYESYFLVPQKNSKDLYSYDEKLGWRLNDGTFRQLHRDFDTVYSVTDGRRNSRSGTSSKRINFYGDSFCFGTGVEDGETVASSLGSIMMNVSIVNHGVPGYGPLQYKLNYQSTRSPFLNIFMIYTGNDYQDLQSDRIAWGPYKPYLLDSVNGDQSYQISYPQSDFRLILESGDKTGFELRSPNFLKRLLKSIPFVVQVRSMFISPDTAYVDESMKRFKFLFDQIAHEESLFVITPSISLVSGISINSDEGYFREKLIDYLESRKINYIDVLTTGDLTASDFFPNEGHNNQRGNLKLAKVIHQYLSNPENPIHERFLRGQKIEK